MKRRLVALLCVGLWAGAAFSQQTVALVASADSPIESLSAFEVRKIYLGIDVMREGRFVKPLRNRSAPLLDEIFLQNVVGLTQSNYERRLIANLLKFGTVRPTEYDDAAELTQALRAEPLAVTYLMLEAADAPTGVKILRILWQEY